MGPIGRRERENGGVLTCGTHDATPTKTNKGYLVLIVEECSVYSFII